MRSPVLVVALVFIAAFAALTIDVAIRHGFDVLVGAALLVLAMFAFGIVGALRRPPGR
jgi:hypothetical protein